MKLAMGFYVCMRKYSRLKNALFIKKSVKNLWIDNRGQASEQKTNKKTIGIIAIFRWNFHGRIINFIHRIESVFFGLFQLALPLSLTFCIVRMPWQSFGKNAKEKFANHSRIICNEQCAWAAVVEKVVKKIASLLPFVTL